jgi:hypothetical protein
MVHGHAIHGEGLRQQGPFPADEAQRAADPHLGVPKHLPHRIDLASYPVDELGAVPTSDKQLVRTRPHETGLSAFDPPFVLFCVDYPHPRCRNRQMVNVRPGVWDAPVVHHHDVGKAVKPRSKPPLPLRPFGPGGCRVWLGGCRQDQNAQHRMVFPYLRFASGASPLVLALRGSTWIT